VTADQDLIDLARDVDQLTRPWRDEVRYQVAEGRRLVRRVHRAQHPSLLDELRQAALGGGRTTGSGPGARSGTLIAADAHDALVDLTAQIRYLCQLFAAARRGTPEENLRALVGRAPNLLSDDRAALCRAVAAIRRQTRLVLGHDQRPSPVRAACPACGQYKDDDGRYVLLLSGVDDNGPTGPAWCAACGTRWEPAEYGVLARLLEAADAARRAADAEGETQPDPEAGAA